MKSKIPVFVTVVCMLVGLCACSAGGGCEHDWGEWQVTTPATCVSKGVETRFCKKDNSHAERRAIAIDPSAHDYGEWQTETAATCLTRQGKEVRECNLCHEKFYRDTTYGGGHVIEDNECKICHTPCTDGLEFTAIKEGDETVAYSLSGAGSATAATEILVPAKHDNLPVTEIASLGLIYCNAEKIYLPDSVTKINYLSFRFNEKLEAIYIGNGANDFSDRAITDCDALKAIIAGDENATFTTDGGILYDKAKTEIVAAPKGLTEVILPDSLTVIGDQAFNGHTALESVTFGPDVTEIGLSAFRDTGLTTVTIPEKVTVIGRCAFTSTNLKTVIWNAEACAEADDAFLNCTSFDTLKIGNTVKSMPKNAFKNGTATDRKVEVENLSVWLNIKFTDYRQNPVYFWHNLYINGAPATEIVIPAYVTELNNTFDSCNNIEKVSFEAGSKLVSLGDSSFTNCINLTEITLPASLEKINKYAFYKCAALAKATFENPEGWQMSTAEDMSETPYLWGTLDDPAQNAAHLKDYSGSKGYYWQRG